jgi:patatin-like phospholipase/acyl hydrolase
MKKRILTIDGGGLLGVGPAKFLMELEKTTGKQCIEMFDGFAGTSTGAILATALALGIPASTIYQL